MFQQRQDFLKEIDERMKRKIESWEMQSVSALQS